MLLVRFEPRFSDSSLKIKQSFDDFRDTLAKIKDAIQVQSAVPTRSPKPNEKWKVRSTRAPKLFPVAVETEFEKRSKNGVKFDRFYWRGVRQECVLKMIGLYRTVWTADTILVASGPQRIYVWRWKYVRMSGQRRY